jgi:hypothetical protein
MPFIHLSMDHTLNEPKDDTQVLEGLDCILHIDLHRSTRVPSANDASASENDFLFDVMQHHVRLHEQQVGLAIVVKGGLT